MIEKLSEQPNDASDKSGAASTYTSNTRPRPEKIARLPREVRDQLNSRLADDQPPATILPWLNALPQVVKVLQDLFAGRPITEQNLSDWKQTGLRAWQDAQHSRAIVQQLIEHARAIREAAGGEDITVLCSRSLALELAQQFHALLNSTAGDDHQWSMLASLLDQYVRLRRDDLRAAKLKLEEERWERKLAILRAQYVKNSQHLN